MNIQNKPKAIKAFAKELKVTEWQIHRAIYELNTGETNVIRNYFAVNDLTARLKDTLVRVEEIHAYLMQSKTINADEFTKLNVRIGHLKTDCKSMIEDYIEIEPNKLMEIKTFIRDGARAISENSYSHEDFMFKLEVLLTDAKKMI